MQRDIFFPIFPSFTLLKTQPSICCDFFQTFSGQIFDFFLTLHSDLQHPDWMCLFDISEIHLVPPEPIFPLNSPPSIIIYHVLDVLQIVRFSLVGVIMNIKNRVSDENTYTRQCCTFLHGAQHCIISQIQPHFCLASNLAVRKRLLF